MPKIVRKVLHLSLMILVVLGLWGALNVSFNTLTGKPPCPDVNGVPICYLVSVGYFLMLLSSLFSASKITNKLFYSGWRLVFVIALFGAASEIAIGGICPRSEHEIPLCYLSLALCLVIVGLYIVNDRFKESRVKN
jgi:hypothetical protein